MAFSDNQQWNGDEDNAPVHCVRGPVACTTTASDETKARTETKTAAEMAYMVKWTLRQKVLALMRENPSSFYTRGKPELHKWTEGQPRRQEA